MRAASDIQAQHVGLIRLGFTQATSESRATRAVAELLRRRPGLRVRLTVGKSDDLERALLDRKSTRLNSSHLVISYAVFCLKKKLTKRAAAAGRWPTICA